MHALRWTLLGLVGWWTLAALPSGTIGGAERAFAQRTGVVLRFTGRQGSVARREVVRAAQERLELIPRAEVEATARDLGADLDTEEGRALVADELGLSVLVSGAIRGRGREAVTVIRVYDDEGKLRSEREAPRPVGRGNRSTIFSYAGEAIDETVFAIQEREAAEEEERLQAEMDARRAAAEAEEAEREDEGGSTDGVGALPIFSFTLGVQGRTRDARVDLTDPGAARTYEAGLYPELTIHLESFFLRGRDDALRGLYAELDFAYALGLASDEVIEDGMGGSVTNGVDTTAWRFLAQVGYQYPFARDRALIGALLGFGIDTFDLSTNETFFASSYPQLRVGLVAQMQILQRLLWVRLDGGFRLVFDEGDLASQHGGDGSTTGYDIGVGLRGRLDVGFTYGARFGFTRYSLGLGGSDAPLEGTGGSDRSFTLGLDAGWSF